MIADATKEQQMAWAERRLDALGERLLLKRFVMLGPHERRRGGELPSCHLHHRAQCVAQE